MRVLASVFGHCTPLADITIFVDEIEQQLGGRFAGWVPLLRALICLFTIWCIKAYGLLPHLLCSALLQWPSAVRGIAYLYTASSFLPAPCLALLCPRFAI